MKKAQGLQALEILSEGLTDDLGVGEADEYDRRLEPRRLSRTPMAGS